MVQAWRLYKTHMAKGHCLLVEVEGNASSQSKKERDVEKKRRTRESKSL
jgi:hypothetical protein